MQRIVIKVGSHVLTQNGKIAKTRMLALVQLIAELKVHKYEVILVSSGAVAAGFTQLPLDRGSVANRQALAAIGQPLLLKMYQEKFAIFDVLCSQVLFSADVFESAKHVAHAKVAIDTLLENNVVPIINENDTVSIEELVFGDNDRLSAHVAHKDPNRYDDAKRRAVVTTILEEELSAEHTPNNEFATGGIVTKLQSADFLMKHGRELFLASGFDLSDAKSFLLDKVHLGGTLFQNKS